MAECGRDLRFFVVLPFPSVLLPLRLLLFYSLLVLCLPGRDEGMRDGDEEIQSRE